MKRDGWLSLLVAATLLCNAVGCRSAQPPADAHAGDVSAMPANAAPAAAQEAQAPAPSVKAKRAAEDEGQIDDQSQAAVRGTQTVNFVVMAGGKPVRGAALTVLDRRGKVAGKGAADDWGELHTDLKMGNYVVKVEAQGMTVQQKIRVDEKTQEVDLKLDAAH